MYNLQHLIDHTDIFQDGGHVLYPTDPRATYHIPFPASGLSLISDYPHLKLITLFSLTLILMPEREDIDSP